MGAGGHTIGGYTDCISRLNIERAVSDKSRGFGAGVYFLEHILGKLLLRLAPGSIVGSYNGIHILGEFEVITQDSRMFADFIGKDGQLFTLGL